MGLTGLVCGLIALSSALAQPPTYPNYQPPTYPDNYDQNYYNDYYAEDEIPVLSPNSNPYNLRSQCVSMDPQVHSAGTLPLRMVVKFVPSVNLRANVHSIVVRQGPITPFPCDTATNGWSVFVPRTNFLGFPISLPNDLEDGKVPDWLADANIPGHYGKNPYAPIPGQYGSYANADDLLPGTLSQWLGGYFGNNIDIVFTPSWDFSLETTVPVSGLGNNAPLGRGSVSSDGKLLMVKLESKGTLMAGVQYEMVIPQRYLSPNLEFPLQQVESSIGFVETKTMMGLMSSTGMTIGLMDGLMTSLWLVAPVPCTVPFTNDVPEVSMHDTLFISAVPDTTIRGQKINYLDMTFILGTAVLAGGIIGFEANQDIFAQPPVAGTLFPTLAVGYNCAAFPTLCCTESVVRTRPISFGNPAPIFNPTPGWATIQIQLFPKGCMIPRDKLTVIRFSTIYLGSNPSIPDRWILDAYPISFGTVIPVNVRMWTSSDTRPVNVQFLGETMAYENAITMAPSQPFTTRIVDPADPDDRAKMVQGIENLLQQVTKRTLFINSAPWTSYVIGSSVVRSFTAVPTSRVTNLNPGPVTFSFVLNGVDITNSSSATVNGVVISSNQGVFKPNVGSMDAAIPAVGQSPADCTTVWFYTNAYGTLIVMLNPLFDVRGVSDEAAACQAALQSGAIIRFTIPQEAFLPNLASCSSIVFDVRMVDPYADRSLFLAYWPGYTGPHVGSVDTATLMHQFGWQTVAPCTSSSFWGHQAGLVTDIATMPIDQRCELVCEIASISPVTAGLVQCPSGALMGTWNGQQWTAGTWPAGTQWNGQGWLNGQGAWSNQWANNLNGRYNPDYMVTLVKVPEAALTGGNWPGHCISGITWPVVVSLPNTPIVAITNFGYIIDSPMFAIVVSYVPTSQSLNTLGVTPNVPNTWQILLIIRMNRLTLSCQEVLNNPWAFTVTTNNAIVQCLFFPATGSNLNGVPLQYTSWGSRVFQVPADGAVVCWTAAVASPTPADDGSDDALFGLLALIAIPVLLCYCLLALLYFLRPKREAPCCVPEYPVQETYWVNAQPANYAPIYTVQ